MKSSNPVLKGRKEAFANDRRAGGKV